MCCQYSDIILFIRNCIYLYGTCCDVLPIQWCYTMELYLFETKVLWCVANTLMLYYGIVFICMERVVTCCQYSDVILWNCIYLYGTCCDVLPIQWCHTMELYLFVWNLLWCVANTVMLYYGIVLMCKKRVVMCCQYSEFVCCDVFAIQWFILWNMEQWCYTMCCDVLPIQWCYTMELYLFVWNVLWCVANTVMLYYGIVFICKKRVVMCCQYSDVILWNCIYCCIVFTCCNLRRVVMCSNTVMLYYGIVFICMERVVMCCQYSDVILWNCIYLYGTCCDVLPIQWCYTMELYLFVRNVLWCVANTVMLYYGIVFICMERVVMCCQYSDVILWNCIYL